MNGVWPATSRALPLAVVLSGVLSGALISTAAAGEQPNRQERASAEVARLIKQLGDDSFAARRRAEAKLLAIGTRAKAQLVAALASDDAEVRHRAGWILKQIARREWAEQLIAFQRGDVAQPPENAESWREMARWCDDTPASRDLFLQMQGAAGELLNLLEQNPHRCAVRLDQIVDRCGRDRRAGLPMDKVVSRPLLTAMVFAAGDERLVWAKQHERFGLHSLVMNKDVRARFDGDLQYQRLLGRWIKNKGYDAEGTE